MTRNRPSDAVDIRHGDALDVLRGLPDESVDAYITDPPYGLSQEPDMAEVLTHWLAGDDYKHRGGGFMGRCLHPDSDVLTSDGWAPVDKVAVGDRVCSLNPATGEIEYVPVVETHRYDYDGDLLRVGGRSAVQVVTPNHNVWAASGPETEWSLRRADSLPRNFMLHNQGVWLGEHTETLTICGKTFRAEPLMRFLGMWLGDGYVCVRRNQPEKQDFIGFSAKKGRKLAAFESACADLGVRYTATPDAASDRTAFYVYDKALLAWLTPLGKAHDKRVPSGILNLSAPLLESLYQGLIETDGTRQGVKGQQVFYTTSEALADDFQTLCLHTGRSAGKTWREGGKLDISGRTTYGDGCWTLSVIQTGKTGYWMDRDGRADRPQPPSVVAVPHHGHVSCVTLERHHVMLTRYDGKTVWTGNSWDSFVPGPAVWREAYRVLKPGGHLLCFAGTRTSDLMGISIRLAGFEIRDRIRCETTGAILPAELAWEYSTGFPKSLDVGKAIDKMGGRIPWSGFAPMFAEAVEAAGLTYTDVDRHLGVAAPGASSCYWARTDHRGGLPPRKYWDALRRLLNLSREAGEVYDEAEREIIAIERRFNEPSGIVNVGQGERSQVDRKIGLPSSDAAKRWQGYGTALKPSYEPIIVARKPLASTVAANVLTYGTGALNIAATRVGTEPAFTARRGGKSVGGLLNDTDGERITSGGSGRWPSNVVLVHVGTAAYTLRHDAPEAVYAYYCDLEEVREVPEPHRRDALGVGEAAVLREGMLERGGQGPAQGADGDDDMHRLPEDVRGVPGMGPERAQEVLLEGVSLEGVSPAGSDGQAAYPGGASEDGGNPDARGAVVAVEGRPIQVPGVRFRDGGPAAAGDAGARAADDEQDVRAGASSGSGEDGRTAADAGRRGASRQRGEGGQPAGEPDGDRPSRPLNGAPRDRTQVQGVAGRGGEAAGGERRLAVPPSLIPPAWLRYFDGVVEIPGCVPVGTRKVRNPSGSVRGDEPSAVVDAVYSERERVPFAAHGDVDGTETVEAWECVGGCPVAEMDAQSGRSVSLGGSRGQGTGGYAGGPLRAQDVQPGYGDEGGASRFFPTFKYQAKADGSERPTTQARPKLRLRADLTDEQRAYVLAELAKAGIGAA